MDIVEARGLGRESELGCESVLGRESELGEGAELREEIVASGYNRS